MTAGQAIQANPLFTSMRHNPLHVWFCLKDQTHERNVGFVGGPAQSASQLLRAMRLDRGLPKGREGLTEREQQHHMSMAGTPGRLIGQSHQARYHLVV